MTDRGHLTETYVVPLPWKKPPMSLNDRGGWRVKYEANKEVIDAAWFAIRAARLPRVVGAVVTLHWRAPDRRRQDTDNMAATLKPCMDALVDEGFIPDDSWVCVPRSGQVIHPPDPEANGPEMWLELAPCD